jgi:hypothetical protein
VRFFNTYNCKGIGEIAQREAVGACAQIDGYTNSRVTDDNHVIGGTPGDGFDVRSGQGVGEVAKREAVCPTPEIGGSCG